MLLRGFSSDPLLNPVGKFGVLAVKQGVATKEQINRGLKEQEHLTAYGGSLCPSDILIQAKIITEKQRVALLESQKELKDKPAATGNVEEDKKEEDPLKLIAQTKGHAEEKWQMIVSALSWHYLFC